MKFTLATSCCHDLFLSLLGVCDTRDDSQQQLEKQIETVTAEGQQPSEQPSPGSEDRKAKIVALEAEVRERGCDVLAAVVSWLVSQPTR